MGHRISAIVTCGWFAACLCLPVLQNLTNVFPDPGVWENRQLVARPKPGMRTTLPNELQTYWSDHFGLRLQLGVIASYVTAKLGDSPSPKVILGKNHWLYLAENLTESIGQLQPLVATTVERHEAYQAWLANRGIVNFVVIPPDKHNVYPEFVPDGVVRAETSDIYRQLRAYVDDHGLALNIVDVGDAIRAQKPRGENLYWESDTHWSALGALVAAVTMMQAFAEVFPAIPKRTLQDYYWTKKTLPGGDLAQMIALPMVYPLTDYDIGTPPVPMRVIDPAFAMPQNNPARQPMATEIDDPKLPKAVFFRDSYMNGALWIVLADFRRSLFVWNDGHFLQDVIEREDPDIVVEEQLERDCTTVREVPSEITAELVELKSRKDAFADCRAVVTRTVGRDRLILHPTPKLDELGRIPILEISGTVGIPTVVSIDGGERREKRVLYPRAGRALVVFSHWPSQIVVGHNGLSELELTLKAVDPKTIP